MQTTKESASKKNVLERRDVALILSAVLFIINFMLFYFIWLYAFPDIIGITRVVICWIGAYALTWLMTYVTKGASRLVLTLIMLGVQYFVFHHRP